MSLVPGTRLGPYEVLSPLGAGGMGVVFRAQDTRLGRDVAVKVLPDHLAGDTKALARFEIEAKAVAALSHPNILALHDVGEADGVSYAVTELLEGETLRAVVSRGALPVRRALEIAQQVADGLAAAHERGIVHRDVKPENVFLTRDGHVKLLDFGLARHAPGLGAGSDTRSPTEAAVTETGAVVGTVAYMSPEQARGTPVDFRSDQFSLGVVLYEMLAGRRPFARETAAETLTAILREEPEPLSKAAPAAPAPVRWILERLLAKDRAERFDSTRDLARDLEACRTHLSDVVAGSFAGASGTAGARSGRLRRAVTAIAAILVGAILLAAGGLLSRWFPTAAEPEFRQLTFDRGRVTTARFAPDGHTVVYSAAWAGAPPQVYSVRLDARESLPLGYPGADLLAVSRTSELALALGSARPSWRAVTGTLARAPFSGGSPRSLDRGIVEADFAPNGESMAVVRVAETRPATCQLEFPAGTVLFRTPGWISSARISRRGDAVAFIEHPEPGENGGFVCVAESGGKVRRLTERFALPWGLAWSPGGDEVWFSAARTGMELQLWSVPLRGPVRRVFAQGGSLMLHDVAPDGRVLASVEEATSRISFRGENDASDRDLSWTGGWSTMGPLPLSHDGRQLLFAVTETEQLYLRNTDGSPPSRIAKRVAGSGFSTLSADGRNVVVVQRRGPAPLLIEVVPTGPGPTRTIRLDGFEATAAGLLPDGRTVWFGGRKGSGGARYWLTDLSGTAPRPATPELDGLHAPWVTPDGRHFLARKGAAFTLFPVDGGEPTAVRGVAPGEDFVQGISMDSRFFHVQKTYEVPASLRRVDVVTGTTVAVREISPADPAGVTNVWVQVTPDGKSLACLTWRFLSKLYVVEGLR